MCCRYQSTQLVLWPDQRVSFTTLHHSPVLRDLVFTRPMFTVYTHTTHRLFPLKTTSQVSAELTEISSMVSSEDRDRDGVTPSTLLDSRMTSVCGSPAGSKDGGHNEVVATRSPLRNGLLSQTLYPPPPLPPSSSLSLSSSSSSHSHSPLFENHLELTRPALPRFAGNNNYKRNQCHETKSSPASRDDPARDLYEQSSHSMNCLGHEVPPFRDLHCVPTDMPKFLMTYTPTVSCISSPLSLY